MNGPFKGQSWEEPELLRIGRLDALEVVLDDNSVSRYHAEVRATDRGWRVRDLGSTNGTRLNGVRLGNGQWPLRPRDLLQFGEVAVVVEAMEEPQPDPMPASGLELEPVPVPEQGYDRRTALALPSPEALSATPPVGTAQVADEIHVEGTTQSPWDQALEAVALESGASGRPVEQLRALLRASHSLVHIEKEDDLLQSILDDAVRVLDAQRGAIALAEGSEGKLKLRALVTGRSQARAVVAGRRETGGRFQFSQSLAARCMSRGESILCHRVDEDPELAMAQSISEGTMASVLCVLLRTPRRRLGVLHLDRSPWQKPFTMDDLRLCDALAASVSAGIECAQLLRKRRDLFLDTITILAQAVELRDEYTGGHTQRVSAYSVMLAEHLDMPPADVELIRTGTPLHDIGKIGIDDAILRKPDKLTPEEFEVMKTHTVKGAEIVNTVPDLRPIVPIVRSHHERWDGKGYPDGLGGEAISPLARVVALADAFDAMTSDRPYRKGLPPEAAFGEIDKGLGRQFDPTFAAAFLAMRERILSEMQSQAAKPSASRKVRVVKA
jgi:putative nucleotidyltransferase with HDIG domain